MTEMIHKIRRRDVKEKEVTKRFIYIYIHRPFDTTQPSDVTQLYLTEPAPNNVLIYWYV